MENKFTGILGAMFILFPMADSLAKSIIEEPFPFNHTKVTRSAISRKEYTEAQINHYNSYSRAAASSAWWRVRDYTFVRSVKYFYLCTAMRMFNKTLSFNPNNYQGYWGLGIVRGLQAERKINIDKKEQYLKDSIYFMKKALLMHSGEQKYRMQLDLITRYNALASYYREKNNPKMAEILHKAEILVKQLAAIHPEDGRVFFLWTVILLEKGSIDEARDKAVKATKTTEYALIMSDELAEALKISYDNEPLENGVNNEK